MLRTSCQAMAVFHPLFSALWKKTPVVLHVPCMYVQADTDLVPKGFTDVTINIPQIRIAASSYGP
jgi:hypothetical protein